MDFGVLNIGTFSPIQASQLKSLKKDSEMKWLMQQAYERVLDKLLKICDISFETEAVFSPKKQGENDGIHHPTRRKHYHRRGGPPSFFSAPPRGGGLDPRRTQKHTPPVTPFGL